MGMNQKNVPICSEHTVLRGWKQSAKQNTWVYKNEYA
jgi:hypothetical protein